MGQEQRDDVKKLIPKQTDDQVKYAIKKQAVKGSLHMLSKNHTQRFSAPFYSVTSGNLRGNMHLLRQI